jgi:hypothetical protein
MRNEIAKQVCADDLLAADWRGVHKPHLSVARHLGLAIGNEERRYLAGKGRCGEQSEQCK